MYRDTIAAISTPLGQGGIGIVRLSGPEAKSIARRLFDCPLRRQRLVHGHIVDPQTSQVVDEVLVAFMRAPHTYTREDVVEINAHGGLVPLQRILELVLREGARLANPGEFTLRAFLNGRLDLAQAEAVLDVVQAKTAAGLRVALEGLAGRLSGRVRELRARLLSVLAYLSARIDFPEDEVGPQEVQTPLQQAIEEIQPLLASADTGMVYRQGVKTAIVGRPNVGKSSLLNCLLRESRAIVTPIPGTTRDTLEEVVNIQGVPFVLVDTAGIVESDDLVERLGVERSRRAVEQADLVLWVVDGSQPLTRHDREIARMLQGKDVLLVVNKVDLLRQAKTDDFPWLSIETCAVSRQGVADLEQAMVNAVLGGVAPSSEAVLVANVRHKNALERAQKHLADALSGYRAGLPDDFITIDLTAALNALGEITGETVGEDLLEAIFSQFCIGK